MNSKIILFGSEGNIGKSLVRLFKREFDLICIDKKKNKKKYKKDFINIDLSKKDNFKRLININADTALILSFYKSNPRDFQNEDKKKFFLINNNILNNCLKICKKFKVKKIIYFSSAAVYKENNTRTKIKENFKVKANNIYSKFKIFAENKIINYSKKNKSKFIILRLFNIFDDGGNDLINNFQTQIKFKENINVNGNGFQCRDFLHIHDMFNVLKKLIINKYSNQILNLCSGRPISIRKIISKINKKKKKIKFDIELKTNYFLVGDNKKIKKLTQWKINKNFGLFLNKKFN